MEQAPRVGARGRSGRPNFLPLATHNPARTRSLISFRSSSGMVTMKKATGEEKSNEAQIVVVVVDYFPGEGTRVKHSNTETDG